MSTNPNLSSPEVPVRKRSVEDMTTEELIASLKKLKQHSDQVSAEKKVAEELYATTAREKEELKTKAVAVLKRCRELEEKNSKLEEDLRNYYNTTSNSHSDNNMKENSTSTSTTASTDSISDLTSKLQKLQEELRESQELVSKLTTQNNELQNIMIQNNVTKETSSTKSDGEVTRIKELEEILQTSTTELTKYKAATEKAFVKLKEMKSELESKLIEISTLQSQIQSISSEKQVAFDKLSEIQKDFDQYKQSNVKSNTDPSSSSSSTELNVIELTKKLEETEKKYVDSQEQFKLKMNKAVEKLKEMKTELDLKTSRITELETIVQSNNSSLINTSHNHDSNNSVIESHHNHDDDDDDILLERDRLAQEVSKLSARVFELESNVSVTPTTTATIVPNNHPESSMEINKPVEGTHEGTSNGLENESRESLLEHIAELEDHVDEVEQIAKASQERESQSFQLLVEVRSQLEALEVDKVKYISKISSLEHDVQEHLQTIHGYDQKLSELEESYQTKIGKAVDKMKDMKSEIDAKTIRITELESSIQSMKDEIVKITQEKSDMVRELAEHMVRISQLEADTDRMKSDTKDAMDKEKNELISRATDFEYQLLSSKKERDQLKLDMEKILSQSSEEKETMKISYNQHIQELETKNIDLKKQYSESQEKILMIESENKDLKSKLSEAEEKIIYINTISEESKKTSLKLSSELSNLTSDFQTKLLDINNQIEVKSKYVTDLEYQITLKEKEIMDIKSQLSSSDQKLIDVASQLSESLASTENDKITLVTKVTELKKLLTSSESMVTMSKDKITSLEQKIVELEQQRSLVTSEWVEEKEKIILNFTSQCKTLEESLTKSHQLITEKEILCNELSQTIESYKLSHTRLSEQIELQSKQIDSLSKTNENLQQSNENILKHNKSILESNRNLSEEIDSLSQSNRDLTQQIENLSQQIERLSHTNNGLVELNESLAQNNESLTNHIQELESLHHESTNVSDTVTALEKEKNDLIIHNGNLTHLVASLQAEVEISIQEKNELKDRLESELEDTISHLSHKIGELEVNLSEASEQIEYRDNYIREEEDRIGNLLENYKNENANLLESLKEYKVQYDNVCDESDERGNRIFELENEIQTLRNEYTILSNQNQQQQEQQQEQNQNNSNSNSNNDSNNNDNDNNATDNPDLIDAENRIPEMTVSSNIMLEHNIIQNSISEEREALINRIGDLEKELSDSSFRHITQEQTIEDLHNKVNELLPQLKISSDISSALELEKKELISRIAELDGQLQSYVHSSNKVAILHSENETLLNRVKELEDKNINNTMVMSSYTQTISDYHDKINRLEEDRIGLTERLTQGQEDSKNKIMKAVERIKELNNEVETKTNHISKLEAMYESFKLSSENQITTTQTKLQEEIKTLHDENNRLHDEIQVLKEGVKDSNMISSLEMEVSRFKNENSDLITKVTELENKMSESHDQFKNKMMKAVERIKELKNESDENKTIIASLQSQLVSHSAIVMNNNLSNESIVPPEDSPMRIHALETSLSETILELTSLKDSYHSKELEIKTLSDTNQQYSHRIMELEKLVVEYQNSMDTYKKSISESILEDYNAKESKLRSELLVYQQRQQEYEVDIISLMERLSLANESERQTNEKYQNLLSEYNLCKHVLEERDTQIASYEDHVKSIESKLISITSSDIDLSDEISKLKKSNENLKRRVDRFRQATECRLYPIQSNLHVDVIMRVQDPVDNETIWCLVNRERAKAELSIDRLLTMNPMPYHLSTSSKNPDKIQSHDNYTSIEDKDRDKDRDNGSTINQKLTEYAWYKESDLDFNYLNHSQNQGDSEKYSGDAIVQVMSDDNGSFSIESKEQPILPPTLQEQLLAQLESKYAVEKQEYQNQIAAIKEELENSQKAFDVYRERAKVSLLKTVNDQQTTETKLHALQDQLKDEKHKVQELESKILSSEKESNEIFTRLESNIVHEQEIIVSLRKSLEEANDEVTRYKQELENKKQSDLKTSQEEHEAQARRLEQLEDDIKHLKAKEQQLMNDMKKRGDVARQMMLDKDKEIYALKQRLQQNSGIDSNSNSSSIPNSSQNLSTSTSSSTMTTPIKVNRTGTENNNVVEGNSIPISMMRKEEMELDGAIEGNDSASMDESHDNFVEVALTAREPVRRNSDTSNPSPRLKLPLENTEFHRRSVSNMEATLKSKIKAMQAEIDLLRSREALSSPDGLAAQGEREKRFVYLKQAILGFFKAKQALEMEHLGRVICAILGLSIEEQAMVMEGIASLAPIRSASTTFESLTSNITSLFA